MYINYLASDVIQSNQISCLKYKMKWTDHCFVQNKLGVCTSFKYKHEVSLRIEQVV